MKVAIIGSRKLTLESIGEYLPKETTEIVSGGAQGIDACAKKYAYDNGIKLTEFLPEYEKYKRGAPLKRNLKIIDYADMVIAFWDGSSKGTRFVIENCERTNKKIKVIYLSKNEQ